MAHESLVVEIENATRTDWLTLCQTEGIQVDIRGADSGIGGRDPFSEFGEPVTVTLVLILGVVASAGLATWVCKQRELARTSLRISITDTVGRITKIDLSDLRYREGAGDRQLLTDLVEAGLRASRDASS